MTKPHQIKDDMLRYLMTNKSFVITDYSIKTGIARDIIYACADNLITLGYVIHRDITNSHTNEPEKIISYHPLGGFFLRQGGFTSERKAQIIKKRLTNGMTIMTWTSTLAIIIISYFNYVATDKANDNREFINRSNFLIDSLRQSNDSLINLLRKDTSTTHYNKH
jgi:hypothetical protein